MSGAVPAAWYVDGRLFATFPCVGGAGRATGISFIRAHSPFVRAPWFIYLLIPPNTVILPMSVSTQGFGRDKNIQSIVLFFTQIKSLTIIFFLVLIIYYIS